MSFTGKGDAQRIDSITATNLRSGQTFTVYGTELLNIAVDGAFCQTSDGLEVHQYGMVYPNPFSGTTNIVVNVADRQDLTVSARNLTGQVVLETSLSVEPGGNEFAVSLSKAGTYFITATSPQGTACYQATCTASTGVGNSIVFKGLTTSMEFPSGLGGYKSGPPHLEYLPMLKGDVIHYTCYSGDMVTYLTDSPGASGNYDIHFVKCTDAAGMNYPVVTIGRQTWMAANLAYIPQVSDPTEGSFKAPRYYVYGYDGENVDIARELYNYSTYGALYNWKAARSACPEGWRLPTDRDWQELEQTLGMNAFEVNQPGWRQTGDVGCLIKEPGTVHWTSSNGMLQGTSGFFALPGGFLPVAVEDPYPVKSGREANSPIEEGFQRMGQCTFFWAASEYNALQGWSRRLGCTQNGIERKSSPKSSGYSVRCIKDVLWDDVIKDTGN
ncbi:MAG: FISUMP domain-containing protein [Bacteroidales bacterium]